MKSPGHQKYPNHKVWEEHPKEKVEIFVDGKKVAESTDVVKLFEDNHPPRFYIPRKDVKIPLEKSAEVSECPFKGHANYFSLQVGDEKIDDAIWTYEQPYDEHMDIKERVAFWDDKYPDIQIVEKPLS